jgi:hypothetical protein
MKTYQLIINHIQLVLEPLPLPVGADEDSLIGSSMSILKCAHDEDGDNSTSLTPAPKCTLMSGILLSPLKGIATVESNFTKKKVCFGIHLNNLNFLKKPSKDKEVLR